MFKIATESEKNTFLVIQEYPTYYLCQNIALGYKECFEKSKYKPNEENIIIKKIEYNYNGGLGLESSKVNKKFNPGKY